MEDQPAPTPSKGLTIHVEEPGIVRVEGLRFDVETLKDSLRNPPDNLFTISRVNDVLMFTIYSKSTIALLNDFRAFLDSKPITSENIGEIRAQCMMPFDCEWNAFVRDETAARENKS